jgi:hypothetical protein
MAAKRTILFAAAAIALTACGATPQGSTGSTAQGNQAYGDSSAGTSAVGGAAPRYTKAYSACMRAHGLADFPDPDAEGTLVLPRGMDPGSAAYQSAQRACQRYAPAGVNNYGSSGGQGSAGNGAGPAPSGSGGAG